MITAGSPRWPGKDPAAKWIRAGNSAPGRPPAPLAFDYRSCARGAIKAPIGSSHACRRGRSQPHGAESRVAPAREDGHEVSTFVDGPEALAYIKSNPGVSALITSAELTAMSGIELCWETRLLVGARPRDLHHPDVLQFRQETSHQRARQRRRRVHRKAAGRGGALRAVALRRTADPPAARADPAGDDRSA